MEKDNEQGKGWEDIAIYGLEPIEEADEDPALQSDRDAAAAAFYATHTTIEKRAAGQPTEEASDTSDLAWYDAIGIIQALYRNDATGNERLIYDLTELTVALFFDKNPDIKGALTEEQRQDLLALFYRAEDYFREKTENGQREPDGDMICFFAWQEITGRPSEYPGFDNQHEIPTKQFPLLRPVALSHYVMPDNKLAKDLRGEQGRNRINYGHYDLYVDKNKKISAYVNISDGLRDIISLTPSEATVLNSAWSIFLKGEADKYPLIVFTERDIYRWYTGGRRDYASPERLAEITKDLDHLSRIKTEIDATDELRHYKKIPEDVTFNKESYILPIERGIFRAKGGQVISAWYYIKKPVALEYTQLQKQLVSIPSKYLDIEDKSITPERIAMRDYMYRRIDTMLTDVEHARDKFKNYEKKRKKDNLPIAETVESFRDPEIPDKMLFSKIYAAAGIQADDRTTIKRNRDFCLSILDSWKGRLFKDYRLEKGEKKSPKKITAVVIEHFY